MTLAELQAALHASGEAGSTESRKRFHERRMAQLAQAHKAGAKGLNTARANADTTDAIVLDAHAGAAEQSHGRHALLALGGYGRRRMAPRSDVDLLFLFGRESDKRPEFISGVLHPLWDVGFDIGNSSRTLSESVKMAREDLESCTAMLDGRLLAGDEALFAEFQARLLKQLPRAAASRLHKLHLSRGAHTGSVQLLEPNVKESPGGLREIHLLEWGLKCQLRRTSTEDAFAEYLDTEDLESLHNGREFLWRVRHEMHFATGRKHDVLENESKPLVAQTLGYSDRNVNGMSDPTGDGHVRRVGTTDRTGADRGRELAVEAFLRDYYLHASATFHAVRLGFERLMARPKKGRRLLLEPGVVAIDNEIELPGGAAWFAEDPLRLLRVFVLSQAKRLALSEPAARLVRQSVHCMDDDTRRSSDARDLFLRILQRKQRAADTLRAMHELGVLGAYLPEFGETTCLVQYDIYHVYTVDEHTLVGLEKLEGLHRSDPSSSMRQIYESLGRRELLFLAMLLHDVGKSRRLEHISEGMAMGRILCERIGLNDGDTRFVLFLIENHQEMVTISQRRDLDDYKMIADFAGRFASAEWLKALYLLSYGDLSAVAADAWSEWQGALLWELYHKTKEQLESGLKALEDRQHARQISDGHLKNMKGAWSPLQVAAFEEHVRQLPPRYLVTYDLIQVERHLGIVTRLASGGGIELEFIEHADRTELVVGTRDQLHLLAKICGALAVHDIDILHADVQTRDDEVVIDTFQVTDIDGTPTLPEWKKDRLLGVLRDVIGGSVEVDALFDRYSANWGRRPGAAL
ncbi:MAG: [protein-PII] uridylyltransferase, partial [Gemmatimonadetes bacterium]|nr:[protein-PII] uridylyltransferase [Gemmatimonadota bacterium]